MASSRSSAPADAVAAAVERSLAAHAPGISAVAVALSGGRDSVALLDALVRAAPQRGLAVSAIHVHHGLSSHADQWAAFCAELCGERRVLFALRRVQVAAGPRASVEAAARHARYTALADAAVELRAGAIALAHHQDDQAETLLLQLGRGAGAHGLAAMPAARRDGALLWLRPLLDVPRTAIDGYVARHRLAYVDDDSNASSRYRRNALRHTAAPALAAVLPGYPATLARAATLQAEAAQLLDELAGFDATAAGDGTTLERAALARLSPARARNLLRWFLRTHGLVAPSAARLAAMLSQLTAAKPDARIRLAHAGVELGVHRGRIVLHPPSPGPFERPWRGEAALVFPHGTLAFVTGVDTGLAPERLAQSRVVVRGRVGGERMQLAAGRPRRALKSLLQDAGVPQWDRESLPLVWCGDALAAVPGIGIDVAFRATPGKPAITLDWRPAVQ
jgi:tRNA(Ile)-lysidine synthase